MCPLSFSHSNLFFVSDPDRSLKYKTDFVASLIKNKDTAQCLHFMGNFEIWKICHYWSGLNLLTLVYLIFSSLHSLSHSENAVWFTHLCHWESAIPAMFLVFYLSPRCLIIHLYLTHISLSCSSSLLANIMDKIYPRCFPTSTFVCN